MSIDTEVWVRREASLDEILGVLTGQWERYDPGRRGLCCAHLAGPYRPVGKD